MNGNYITERLEDSMKISNLRVGNTYYMPTRYCPSSYTVVVLIAVFEGKRVLLEDKKGRRFTCSADKLHKRPDKAVKGYKAQRRIREQMKAMEEKKNKSNSDLFVSKEKELPV